MFKRFQIGTDCVLIGDGQAEAGAGTAPNLILVLNWFEELKRLVPIN